MLPGPDAAIGRDVLFEQILEDQTAILRALHDRPFPQWLHLNLTVGQAKALFVLFQAGPTPVGHLGAILGLGKPAATILVNALERHGLVERHEDPVDRRRTLVRLSPSARSLLEEEYTGSRQCFERWLDVLDPDDLDALARGLRALAGAATADRLQAASQTGEDDLFREAETPWPACGATRWRREQISLE